MKNEKPTQASSKPEEKKHDDKKPHDKNAPTGAPKKPGSDTHPKPPKK